MRFMVLLKADKTTEAGVLASEKQLAEMGKYNEELAKAGVLLSGERLQPSSEGATRHPFRDPRLGPGGAGRLLHRPAGLESRPPTATSLVCYSPTKGPRSRPPIFERNERQR